MAESLFTPKENGDFLVQDGILRFKGRIFVGKANNVRTEVMEVIHNTTTGGNSSVQDSYQKAKNLFYWIGMRSDLQDFISACDVCKKCKTENVPYPGLLQPLGYRRNHGVKSLWTSSKLYQILRIKV